MKRKNTSCFTGKGILVVIFIALACAFTFKPDQIPRKYFGISIHAMGVITGKTIKIYQREGSKWTYTTNNTFSIPADAKDVFLYQNDMGVYRKSGIVDFYKNSGPGKWQLKSEKFTVAKEYDHVIPYAWSIGFVKGNHVDFYYEGKPYPSLNFDAPEGTKNIYSSDLGIVLTTDSGLDLYRVDETTKYWKLDRTSHFEFPKDYQGFVQTSDGQGFGIVRNNEVELYTFLQSTGPMHFINFSIPKQ
jgi:hypothetical protein